MTATIEAPRSPRTRQQSRVNFEKWGWIYMRASGVVLVVLIFGHLFVNLVAGVGVKAVLSALGAAAQPASRETTPTKARPLRAALRVGVLKMSSRKVQPRQRLPWP